MSDCTCTCFSHLGNIYCVNFIFILKLKNVAVYNVQCIYILYDFRPLIAVTGPNLLKKQFNFAMKNVLSLLALVRF